MAPLCLALLAFSLKRRTDVYRGRFTDGFETSKFVPCGSSEKWWAKGNVEPIYRTFYPDYDRSGLPREFPNIRFKTGYVEVEGTVTWRGTYGHMGEYDREIRIEKVIQVRNKIPSTCPR
jgi:hypothetical protein